MSRVYALLALLLAAAVYWPGLSGDLVLDDRTTLEPLVALAGGELGWSEVLASDPWRPVAIASYLLNWATTGDSVLALKLTNLVIHLLCGLLVYVLAERLLARVAGERGPPPRWLAAWVAAAWLLAPLLVSTVLYVTQRMAMLAALFTLAGLVGYVLGRERLAGGRRAGIAWMVTSLALFWPLAVLSKQNGILLPLLAWLVEWSFYRPAGEPAASRTAARILAGFAGLAVVIGAAMVLAVPGSVFSAYQHRPFSAWERLLTEGRVLFDYLANLLLVPGASPFGIYHDDYPVSRGLLSPPSTLAAGLGWLAVVALAWRGRATRLAPVAFGVWFFLAAHLVESTLVPLEIYFEHRNYLPAVGIFLALGHAGWQAAARVRPRRAVLALVALVPLGFAVMSYQRVLIWRSWEGILLAAERHHPGSARVLTGLAALHMGRAELGPALAYLRRAAARDPAIGLGIAAQALAAYCRAGRPAPPSAYAALAAAPLGDDTYTVNALGWLAGEVERGQCPGLDLARVAALLHERLLGVDRPGRHRQIWLLQTRTAALLAAAGRRRDALAHLDIASRLEPGRLEPGLLALGHRLALGEIEAARRTLADLRRRDTGRVRRQSRLIEEYARRLE